MEALGFTIFSSSESNCTNKATLGCTSLDGVRETTISELSRLKRACSCAAQITGGTEAGHSTVGASTHADGDKIDLSSSSTYQRLNDFIRNNARFKYLGTVSGNWPQYQDLNFPDNIYTLEYPDGTNEHWDIRYTE